MISTSTILTITVCLIIIVYYIHNKLKSTWIKSTIDNRYYRVKSTGYPQESADTLAIINQKMITLIEYLGVSYNQHEYSRNIRVLRDRYNPDSLTENIELIDTSYTINKGKSVVFCLKTRDSQQKLYDINLLTFVALHELAHIACFNEGHGEEFKNIFKFILQNAIDIKLYSKTDYSKNPQEYCGINVNFAPLL